MLFTKLTLNYFGRFHNKEIELKPGMNLIYGENEAGKSTIHTFIKGMLFGIERLRGRGSATKEDLYTRYLPWDYPGAFNGSMDIKIGEKEYRLQRSFHTSDKYFTVLDLSSGREVKLKEGHISELLPGFTESTFRNTISIEQLKAQTDTELAAQVRNYIANLSVAKSKEVNVAKAVSTLTEQRKQLELSQNTAALKELQENIEEGLRREERIDRLTLQLKELQAEEQRLLAQKNEIDKTINEDEIKRMEQLPAILEKFKTYQELIKQINMISAQETELEEKIAAWEKEQSSAEALKEDRQKAEKIKNVLVELERHYYELAREKEDLQRKKQRNIYISTIPFGGITALLLILSFFTPVNGLISLVPAVAGMMIYAVINGRLKEKRNIVTEKENQLQKERDTAQIQLENILQGYQVATVEQLSEKQEELLKHYYALENAKEQLRNYINRKSGLDDNRDMLYDEIMKYMQYFIREEELTETAVQRLSAEIRERKQTATSRKSRIDEQYNTCRINMEKLRWEISTMEGNEEQLLKNKSIYEEMERKQKEDAVEIEAIKLALSTIQELSSDIHDSFGRQLNVAVSEVVDKVTEHKYTDLKVDEKLDVKVGWNGNYILLERLSAGTIDQIYFALRLAVADLLLGQDEVPLILDDSFALYDEDRVRAALRQISDRSQTILFTCHKREEKLLQEMEVPYHLIDLSCR